jgi:hypothetical protein
VEVAVKGILFFANEPDGEKNYAGGWDESKHPRHPTGSDKGGEFAPSNGASANGTGVSRSISKADAQTGADLAEDLAFSSRRFDESNEKTVNLWALRSKGKKLVSKGGPRIADELDKWNKIHSENLKIGEALREKADAFEKKHGIDVIEAWEATKGRRWPNYRVDSGAPSTRSKVVIKENAVFVDAKGRQL